MAADMSLDRFLERARGDVNAALDRLVPEAGGFGGRLQEAMRYSLFSGGKRLRPCLCFLVHHGLKEGYAAALPFGCALEMIHTYSLIHDDLPAMDDDDLRRGRASCHKAFDEATAILAGDGLLTKAFEIAVCGLPGAEAEGAIDARRRLRMIAVLARAAGPEGMVLGQMRDLLAAEEGGASAGKADLTRVRDIHAAKTAAMISACFELGALAAGSGPEEAARLARAGMHVGLAFQIIDDILDVVATTTELGKTAGKDAADGKATYPAAIGLEASRREAAEQTAAALDLLPKAAGFALLREAVERMLSRSR